jgi:hypothetical protein
MLDGAWDVVSESRAAAAPVGWIAPNSIPSMVKMRVKTLDSTIHSALIIGHLTWNAASGEITGALRIDANLAVHFAFILSVDREPISLSKP